MRNAPGSGFEITWTDVVVFNEQRQRESPRLLISLQMGKVIVATDEIGDAPFLVQNAHSRVADFRRALGKSRQKLL